MKNTTKTTKSSLPCEWTIILLKRLVEKRFSKHHIFSFIEYQVNKLEEDIEGLKQQMQMNKQADLSTVEQLAGKYSELHYYKIIYDKLVSVL